MRASPLLADQCFADEDLRRAARSKPNSESPGERALGWAVGRTVRPVVRRSECARRARQLKAASEGRSAAGRCWAAQLCRR